MDEQLLITQCDDSMMWYADLVGHKVPLVRVLGDCYISRDVGGFTNIVKKEDAEIV